MDRKRLILIAVGIALAAFLTGFLPQWARANRNGDALEAARTELRVARTEGKIAAALTESLRSNYELSRQLMTEVYAEIQRYTPAAASETERRELQAILAQRDEIITLLARAAPESSQRLMLIHTRYRQAMNPEAVVAPVTPPAGS